MTAPEPKRMPAFEDATTPEMLRHPLISIGISNHSRGNNFPAFVYEPRKITVERNRAAITHTCRSDPHHIAADDTPADASAVGPLLDIQFDFRTWQQPMVRLDQCTSGGHVDQASSVSRVHTSRPDAMFLESVHAPDDPPFL